MWEREKQLEFGNTQNTKKWRRAGREGFGFLTLQKRLVSLATTKRGEDFPFVLEKPDEIWK